MDEDLNITNIVNNETQPAQSLVQLQQNLQQKATAKQSGATSLYDSLKVPYFGGTGVQQDVAKPSIEYQIPIEEGYNLVGDEYISKYPTYEVGRDNAELAAQNQTTFDKWSNGLTKAGANLLTTVAGNTVGFVVGAAEGISQGSWNAVFDNGFSNMLADYNDKLNYQLPNYVSKDEQDDNFLESMGTANFWAKDVAGGLSFTLGTVVSEAIWAAATGGIANSAKWGLQGAKLANKLRWGKAALGVEEAAVGVANYKKLIAGGIDKLYKTTSLEATTAKIFANTAKTLNTARFLATSSGNEAGIEALQYKREQTENFYSNFEKLNGRNPNEDEIAEFNDDLENSANIVFATNMAILAPSNIAMFGSLFNIASPTKGISKAMNKSLFGIGVEKTLGETGEVAYKGLAATGKQKIAQYTYATLKPLVTEALWEEGLQGVTTKSAENWITSTYDPKYNNKTIALSDATYKAFAEQYGSKEGWKEIGIGAIIGGGSSVVIGRGKFQEVREFEKEQKYQEDYVAKGLNQFGDNSTLATDAIVKKIMFNARITNAVERQKEAIDKGDDIAAALSQQDALLAEMQFRKAMGEDTKELVSKYETALRALPKEAFEERGISDSESYKDLVVEGYKNLVGSYEKASDFADAVLGESKILGQDISTQHLKDALTYSIVSGEKANKAMDGLLQEMSQIIGNDSAKTMQIQTELQKMGKNKQQQVRRVNTSMSQAEQEVKTLSTELQRLQVLKDEEKGARLQAVQEKLTNANEKVIRLKAEREELAKEVSQESKRRRSVGGLDITGISLNTEFISGSDLADIDGKLQKIEDSIKGYEGVNHEIYYDLLDLKRQYVTAKENFFSFQSSVDSIIRGDFAPKFSKMNGLLGRVFEGKDKSIKNFTNDFLAETFENFRNSGARLAAQDLTKDMISDEDYNTFKEAGEVNEETLIKLAEKVKTKEELTEREREIYSAKTQEINSLTKSNPNKPDLRVEIVTEKELKALEAEKTILENQLENENFSSEDYLSDEQKINLEASINKVNIEPFKKIFSKVDEVRERFKNLINKSITVGDNTIEIVPFRNNELVQIGGRVFIKVLINGVPVTFYQSTGLGNKSLQVGRFYPTLGVEADERFNGNWINKLGAVEMAQYYGSPDLAQVGDFLDNNFGNLTDISDALETKIENLAGEFPTLDEALEFRKQLNFEYINSERKTYQGLAKDAAEITKDFNEIISKIKNNKTQDKQELKNNTQEKLDSVNKKITVIKSQNGTLTEAEQLRLQIEQSFEKDYPMLTQDVDEMIKEKPTEQEIERYQELYKKQTNFSETEKNEFEELQPRMQRWFMAQSLPVRGATIADLVEILSQLETTLDREETLTEINSDDLIEETAESKDASSMQRQDILQNMSGNAVTKIVDNDIYFMHIEAKTLIDKLLPLVSNASIQTVNDKNKLTKAQDLTPKLLAENSKKEGTIFTIGDTKIIIGKKGSVVMSLEDYNKTKDIINLYYFDSNSGKWSYADLYERLDDDTSRKKPSEFSSNTISDNLFDVETGDSLNLFVDMKTDWNRGLIYEALEEIDNKGEISDELKKKIQGKLEITSRKGRDNNSTLKAAYDNVIDDNFIYLRKKYADKFIELLETEQALATLPSKINLEAEVVVKDMFLGTPTFQLDENLKPKELPITERGVEKVLAQGYVQGSEMLLGDKTLDVEEVSRLYITNLVRANPELKIPIVILQKGKYKFAFPISMVKTSEDKSSQLEAISVATETPTEVIKLVNNLMISLGLNTRITKVTPEIIEKVRTELTNYTTFKTADEIADVNYNKNQLLLDATIKVDLENEIISSPKVTVDYKTLTIGKIEENETDAVNLRESIVQDLKEIEKIVNSSVEIPDKNKLIEAFDNNSVENKGTDIMNRKDINFIKEVFFTEAGKLKSIRGKAVETIGKDKLLNLRDKLQMLQFYEAQIKTIKDKNTEKNLKCK
jgi:hypothetical protein